MRPWLKLLIILFINSPILMYGDIGKTSVEFETGYREDQVSWHLTIPSPNPIAKDNLEIKDIHIFQIGVNASTLLDCNLLIKAKAHYGWILDGVVKETLITVDHDRNRIQEAQGHYILDGKHVADLSIGIGYPYYFCDCSLSISPLLGYAYNTQSFSEERNTNHIFAFNEGSVPNLDIKDTCTHNKYVYTWYGPWAGLDFTYSPNGCLDLYVQLEYHFTHFSGKRNSDVRFKPIDNYDHSTHHAHGTFVKVGANHQFSDCCYAGLSISYQDWSSRKHVNLGNALSTLVLTPPNGYEMRSQNKWRSVAYGITFGKIY